MSVAVADGWIYAVGGSDERDALDSVERYDPMRDVWSPVTSMRLPRSSFATVQLEGKIYAIGEDKENL